MMKKVFSFALVAAAMLFAGKANAQVSTFPWTYEFTDSTQSVTDWTIVDKDGDNYTYGWYGTDGHDNDGCMDAYWLENDFLITPALQIPAGSNFKMSFWTMGYYNQTYYQYYGYVFYGSYVVKVSTTTTDSAAFTDSIYAELQVGHDWEQQIVDLSAYAGQTIYIAFYCPSTCYGGWSLDDVKIGEMNEPIYTVEGETGAQVGESASFSATYLAGAQSGMTTTWTSTMAAAGNATIANPNDLNTTITYTATGTDMVIFTATNSYGTYADTINVTVYSCDAVTTFPWEEGFEDASADCWTLLSNDGGRAFARYENEEYANTGSFCILGPYSDDYQVDQWAISPEITLPANSPATLSFYVMGGYYQGALGRYEVLVSNGSTATNDFTSLVEDTIGAATYSEYARVDVPLGTYAGQTIRIAIRNHTDQGGDALLVDDITITTGNSGISTVNAAAISVNPNPATEMVSVSAEGVEGNVTVSIIDLNGRTVMQQNGNAGSFRFNVSSLAAGSYFVKMVGENVNSTSKLIVK